MRINPMPSRTFVTVVLLLAVAAASAAGCKGHRPYHAEPAAYLQEIPPAEPGSPPADLAVVEFDDQGIFWEPAQLAAAVAKIRQRNAETPGGVLVVMFCNSWQNDADPRRQKGNLWDFRRRLARLAVSHHDQTGSGRPPSRVVGVYLGWRGITAQGPGFRSTSFWNRRGAALRVAGGSAREAVLEVLAATREHPRSRSYVVGHSMGGLVLAKALEPVFTTLLLTAGSEGVALPTDSVMLLNPALDALSSWRLIQLLKRTGAQLETRRPGEPAMRSPGPLVASLTSEADAVLRTAFPIGTGIKHLPHSFQGRLAPRETGLPKQRSLATHAEGAVEALASHHAWVDEGGEVRMERIPGAWNDTPYWVIRVSEDISGAHSDTDNPPLNRLLEHLVTLNGLHDTQADTWLVGGAGGR